MALWEVQSVDLNLIQQRRASQGRSLTEAPLHLISYDSLTTWTQIRGLCEHTRRAAPTIGNGLRRPGETKPAENPL